MKEFTEENLYEGVRNFLLSTENSDTSYCAKEFGYRLEKSRNNYLSIYKKKGLFGGYTITYYNNYQNVDIVFSRKKSKKLYKLAESMYNTHKMTREAEVLKDLL
jgi:hypothetical protein